jgi:hypothetical protein
MIPTVGRTVHYKLSAHDAEHVNDRRRGGDLADRNGNQAAEGDICAAVVVRTFGASTANLQVQLDGDDHYWATSRMEGTEPGQWSWPPRS